MGKHAGSRGIWAIDRGGDRGKIYDKFLGEANKRRFVIRLDDRNIIHKGKTKNCKDLAKMMSCPYQTKIIKYEDGKEIERIIHFGIVSMKLPNRKDKLYMVAAKGFGQEPMMLIANCEIDKRMAASAWRIIEIYLTRWKCEESYRYIKQCYNLEDIRVRSYVAIRNIVCLVMAVSYFAAVYLGKNIKLKIMIEKIYIVSKRFFGVPTFFNYAMAEGIYALLFPDKSGLRLKREIDDFQLNFDFG